MQGFYRQKGDAVNITPVVAVAAGDVIQLPDGRAGLATSPIPAGIMGAVQVTGIVQLSKNITCCMLPGQEAFLDVSAAEITYRKVDDKDFYVGLVQTDAAYTDTTVFVALNVKGNYTIDVHETDFNSVPTGTVAAGAFGYPKAIGGSIMMELTATSEAQCIDLLSMQKVAVDSNPIAEFWLRAPTVGSGAAVDANFGFANGTSTTDADAITESVFFHFDGGSLNIYAESDDGTTEVNATDTTVDITEGLATANKFFFQIDARNPADCQLYVNGVNVLPNSTFALTVAAGPLGLLAHLEKTTGTTTARWFVDAMRAYTARQ